MLLPVRGFHNGRDRCAFSTTKQAQNFLLLRFRTRLGCDRFLFGTSPRLHLAAGGCLRLSLCVDHFDLLPWIVTARMHAPKWSYCQRLLDGPSCGSTYELLRLSLYF